MTTEILNLILVNFFPALFLVFRYCNVDLKIGSLLLATGIAFGFDMAFSYNLVYILEKLR